MYGWFYLKWYFTNFRQLDIFLIKKASLKVLKLSSTKIIRFEDWLEIDLKLRSWITWDTLHVLDKIFQSAKLSLYTQINLDRVDPRVRFNFIVSIKLSSSQ